MKNKTQIIKQVMNLLLLLTISATTSKAETASAAHFLLSDGTLNIAAIAKNGQDLTLNLEGWHIELDPKRGPVFSLKPPPPSPWSALDIGLGGSAVYAMAVSSTGNIYVGGDFRDEAGGTQIAGLSKVAKWNGTAWSALKKGLNHGNTVRTIAVMGTDVYVGGDISGVHLSDNMPVSGMHNIAKWSEATLTWSALGTGLNLRVYAIAISGTDVYVGGSFTDVFNGTTNPSVLNKIAKWTPAGSGSWSPLDMGLDERQYLDVFAIAISGNDVYVGGAFQRVGCSTVSGTVMCGTPVSGLNQIAKWNGTAWSALDKGLNNYVRTIAVKGPDVYVGGNFNTVGPNGTTVLGLNCIAKWNGT